MNTSTMETDVLAWLLPDARAEERARVRRTVTALRLLRDDARVRESRRVEPSWARARGELERLERRARLRAVDALLHAYLTALAPSDSFLDLGPRSMPPIAAWRALLEADGAERAGFPPAPVDPPFSVVERLLDLAAADGAPRAWCELWGACRKHVECPGEEAETRWQALFERAGRNPVLRARSLAGLVAARLDRGDPRRARELESEAVPPGALEPGLRRLLGWSALLCGEPARARELLADLPPCPALPLPLLELRAAVPAWAELLAGTPRTGTEPAALARASGRRALGAVVLAVLALRPDGSVARLALDAPGALRQEIERALAGREGAPHERGQPEQRLVAGGGPVRLHASEADVRPPCGALGPRSLALALQPVHGARGAPAGWLHVECEHHLLPCTARLASLAREWREAVLAAAAPPVPAAPLGPAEVRPTGALETGPLAADDPRREFGARLLHELGGRAGRRAWWIELDERGRPVVLAERGSALADWQARAGGGRALGRALERRAAVEHRADPDAALHRGAACGLVLPLLDGAELLGALVLESERDLGERAAAEAALLRLEPLWWATAFRAWHRARYGADLVWLPRSRFLAALGPALRTAAEARAPELVVGPAGAGRRTLARWLHFRGPGRASALAEGVRAAPEGARGSRVVELESLGPAEQCALARAVEAGSPERLLLVAEAPAPALRARGLLDRELERAIDPLPLVVPRLADRRDEIPALVRMLGANVARREGLAPARFADRALGDLWRQDWRGNVAELAALVGQLARAHPGREIDGAAVGAAFRSRQLRFRERLPSLRPRTVDLEDALAVTRHASGSWNRARAARYLGWDPDTLAARLGERRIEEGAGSRKWSREE